MIESVTAPDGADVEVLGVGAAGLLAFEPPPLPPHPHAVMTNAATANILNRMTVRYASRMPG